MEFFKRLNETIKANIELPTQILNMLNVNQLLVPSLAVLSTVTFKQYIEKTKLGELTEENFMFIFKCEYYGNTQKYGRWYCKTYRNSPSSDQLFSIPKEIESKRTLKTTKTYNIIMYIDVLKIFWDFRSDELYYSLDYRIAVNNIDFEYGVVVDEVSIRDDSSIDTMKDCNLFDLLNDELAKRSDTEIQLRVDRKMYTMENQQKEYVWVERNSLSSPIKDGILKSLNYIEHHNRIFELYYKGEIKTSLRILVRMMIDKVYYFDELSSLRNPDLLTLYTKYTEKHLIANTSKDFDNYIIRYINHKQKILIRFLPKRNGYINTFSITQKHTIPFSIAGTTIWFYYDEMPTKKNLNEKNDRFVNNIINVQPTLIKTVNLDVGLSSLLVYLNRKKTSFDPLIDLEKIQSEWAAFWKADILLSLDDDSDNCFLCMCLIYKIWNKIKTIVKNEDLRDYLIFNYFGWNGKKIFEPSKQLVHNGTYELMWINSKDGNTQTEYQNSEQTSLERYTKNNNDEKEVTIDKQPLEITYHLAPTEFGNIKTIKIDTLITEINIFDNIPLLLCPTDIIKLKLEKNDVKLLFDYNDLVNAKNNKIDILLKLDNSEIKLITHNKNVVVERGYSFHLFCQFPVDNELTKGRYHIVSIQEYRLI